MSKNPTNSPINKSDRVTLDGCAHQASVFKPSHPMQLLVMDNHKVNIVRACVNLGVWDDLHPEVKTRLETTESLWVSLAMDACTRSVCALHATSHPPDAGDAIATLAMAVRNKDRPSGPYGRSEWPQCGSPDAVLHENAACYTSDAFGKVVMRLTGKLAVSSSQYPHLAARGERFWSTLQRHGVQTCQETISTSFLDKRSYDSEKHAHLTQQDLLDDLLRLLVWCYHNTRNAALDGETPLQRWNSLAAANNGIAPPPSRAKYRDLFGLEFTRKAGASGITILNVDYQSSQLTDLWSLDPDHEFELRVDDQDISVISYRDPHSGCWCDAASSQPGLENVSLAEWMATVRFVMSRCDPFEESEMKAEVSKALNDARTGRPNQML